MTTRDKTVFWMSSIIICVSFMLLGAEAVYIEVGGFTSLRAFFISLAITSLIQGIVLIKKYIK